MPDDWKGHPLLRDYALGEEPVEFKHGVKPKVPSEIIPYVRVATKILKQLGLRPMKFMELNLGPQHPSTHGVLRIKLRLEWGSDHFGGTRHRLFAYRGGKRM